MTAAAEDTAMIDQQARGRTWLRAALLCSLPLFVALIWGVSALLEPEAIDEFVLLWGLSSTMTTAIGALILWLRPGHAMGRLLAGAGLLFGAGAAISLIVSVVDPFGMRFPRITPVLMVVGEVMSTVSLVAGSLIVIVRFPSGRRTSRLGLAIEAMVVVAIGGLILSELLPMVSPPLRESTSIPLLLAYPLAAVDVILRYRRASSLERVQFRWLIASATVTAVLVVLMLTVGAQVPWLWSAWIFSTMLPTVAIGVAVLRYRLYDIDRIISRSLTYGALTLVLFAIFFATNILLQNAISPLVDGNVIATAVSTLLVASLFQPVRRRIQRVVDRRFHRARYDADRTVDAFAGRLRDSVDLPRLVGDLRQTAGGAVEPASATVWLRGARP
jgi:hypothetical protein